MAGTLIRKTIILIRYNNILCYIVIMIIKYCFYFFTSAQVCVITIENVSINLLKSVFLIIIAGDVACGRDLGLGQDFMLFFSS